MGAATYPTVLHTPRTNLQSCHSTASLLYPKPNRVTSLKHQQRSNLYQKPTNKINFGTHPFCSSNHLEIKASSSSSMSSSAPATTAASTDKKPFRVLFVCLGNICRSPAAEAVFRDVVKKRGLESHFVIDSAGTINYHEGNPADPRMRAASKRRGIEVTSISRPIQSSDFINFDIILAMDKQNRGDILEAFNRWKFREPLPDDAHKKVKLMCSFCKKHDETEVPDPYYGGPRGFEMVLDLLEDACESLLDSILAGEQ